MDGAIQQVKSRSAVVHAIRNTLERSFKLVLVSAILMLSVMALPPLARGHTEAEVPVITIHAKQYEFIPSEITVKAGQRTRLIFISDDVPHGISVEELLSDVSIKKGKPTEIEITPSKAGDFQGQCSWYCGMGHARMNFLIHVMK
jgi:cytochrome c oxidase subunit II